MRHLNFSKLHFTFKTLLLFKGFTETEIKQPRGIDPQRTCVLLYKLVRGHCEEQGPRAGTMGLPIG